METIKTKETIEKDLTLATIEVSIMAIKLNHKAFTKTVFNQIPIENFRGCMYIHNKNSKLYLDNPLGELIQVSPDFSKNDLGLLGFEDLNIQKVIAYCLIEKQGIIMKWYLYVDKEGVLRKTKNPPMIVCPYNNEEQKTEFVKEYKNNFKKFNKYFDLINSLPNPLYGGTADKEELKISWLNGDYCSKWQDEYLFENESYSNHSSLTKKQKKDMVTVLNWFQSKNHPVLLPSFNQTKQVYVAV